MPEASEESSGRVASSVIFLHIPKASGTTLHQIIERQYLPSSIYSFGSDADESVATFKKLPEERRARIKMLKGHMGFGLHQYLPQPSTYITILREPVSRTISYYNHILRNPTHYLYDKVKSKNLSLRDVLADGMTENLDNGQTRLISGVWKDVPVGHCTEDYLQAAKANLRDYFQVVGLTERFEESFILMRRAFGWRYVNYTKANVDQNRPAPAKIPEDTLELIEKYNRLDVALYQYANELFNRDIKRQRLSFEIDLRLFQGWKRFNGPQETG